MNRVELIAALEEKFPDVAQSGLATRSQVLAVTSYIPQWLNAAKIDRGLYAINGGLTSVTEQKPVSVESTVFVSNDVPTSTINVEVFDPASLIPLKDPMFVPFGNYSDIKQIIASKIFYPVYVYGPTGNGKSTMIEQVCANLKRPVIRVNLNQMTDEDQLIGSKTLEDGNIKIIEGPMLIAMRYGIPIVCLERTEEIKVGTLENNQNVKLSDMEIGKEYPIISYNLKTSEFENDTGVVLAESERDDLYVIEFEDGTAITMTSDHPVITERNYEKSILSGLSVGDLVISL